MKVDKVDIVIKMVYPSKIDPNKVFELREKGLTIREIAKKLDVSHNAIWKILRKNALRKAIMDPRFESSDVPLKVDKVDKKEPPKELAEQLKHAGGVAGRGKRTTELKAILATLDHLEIPYELVKDENDKVVKIL